MIFKYAALKNILLKQIINRTSSFLSIETIFLQKYLTVDFVVNFFMRILIKNIKKLLIFSL